MTIRRRPFPTLAALAIAAGVLGAPPGAGAAVPCLLTEATRIHTFNVELDGDSTRERIDVFNLDATGAPMTLFQVCDRRGGDYARGQRTVVTTSPGDRTSGLRQAWAGDLDRDRRIEIAVRDHLTPSAGEVLSVYRQKARHARTFRLLQRISGDATSLTRHSRSPATITVSLKANHARDGRTHTERWRFSKSRRRWACRVDCGGR